MERIALVMNVRNEERHITNSLQSILDQDLRPYRIIVINDGSTDSTRQIVASSFPEAELINMPVRNENHLGRKEIPQTINRGLVRLHSDDKCEYVWLSGGDLVFPRHYSKEIVLRMKRDSAVVTSGSIENEFSTEPRGGGRIVDAGFWKQLGMLYPENYGWEGYLVLKACSLGFKVDVYQDLIVRTQRVTGTNLDPARYRYYGLALKALGYAPPHAICRSILFMRKSPRGVLYMLGGYFSDCTDLYESELRDYVRKMQYARMFKIESVKRFLKIARSRK